MKRFIVMAAFLIAANNLFAQRLIVRMDDIGASHAENLAVIKCYQEGIGRSAEVMSVCPWFMEAATMLNENPGLDVGVHIAFRSEWVGYKWRPITVCPTLCDEDGFLAVGMPGAQKPDIKEAEAELRAQIELAMKYIKNVTHITDHCMWTMDPEMHKMAVRVAEEYGLRYQGQASEDSAIGINNLPLSWGGGSFAERLLDGIKKMEKGKTYWTIEHPGLDIEEMKGIYEIGRNGQRSNVGKDRQAVTDAFTDPAILKYIKENGIELVSFGDVIRENSSKK